jgi:acetyl-CoA C-acetyltransferase
LQTPVIASACRTAIGKYGRSLVGIPAPRLGSVVVKEAVARAGIAARDVKEVIMGNVISAGTGQNPARQAALFAGVPVHVGSLTVNKVCGSGLKAVMLAAQAIRAGDAEIIVAGGMENMSNSPFLVDDARWGQHSAEAKMRDSMIVDGLWDVYNDFHMGMTGERVARKYGVTRKQADGYAYESHMRAWKARESGRFREEVVPVEVKKDGNSTRFELDECIRGDTTPAKLAALRPAFKADGVLTAGNSSQLSDGASALVIMEEEKARKKRVSPLARIVAYETGGTKPEDVMEAPLPTVRSLLRRTGLTMADIDLVEYNEAYSVSSIVVRDELGIPKSKFNVNGGAVALGHPLGCSGARILTTLIYEMRRRGAERGLATLCLGGGNAVAMIVEAST